MPVKAEMSATKMPTAVSLRVLQAGVIAGCALVFFELCKLALKVDIQIRTSQLIAVLCALLGAVVANFWIVLWRRGVGQRISATEARYRLLFERSLAGAYRTTLDGHILDCNNSLCQIFGYLSPQEVIGRLVQEVYIDPEDRGRFIAQLQKEKQVTNFELRLRKADGKIVWILNSAALVENDDGSEPFIRGTLVDITGLRSAEQEQRRLATIMRKSEVQYRLLFERNPVPMWVFDRSTLKFLAVNEAAIRKYGYSEQELLSMTIEAIRPAEELPRLVSHLAERQCGLQPPESWHHRLKDGSVIDVEIVCHDLDFTGVDAMLVAVYDVTERERTKRLLEESESRYRVLFEDSPDAYWLLDQNRFVDCNAAGINLFGFSSKTDFIDPASISPPLQPDGTPSRIAADRRIASALQNGNERFEWLHQRKNGEKFFSDISLSALKLNGRKMLLACIRDITDRKAAEARAQYLAYYDALTDLPNLTLLKDRLEVGLAGARRRGEEIALLFLDLDRFAVLNDSLGRSFGDQILKEVTQRFKHSLRDQDTLARIGGDEFVILLNGVQCSAEAGIIAKRVMESLTQPFEIGNQMANMNCSIGISLFPHHGSDAEGLIKSAETAMRCAKDDGRKSFRFFSEEINGVAAHQLALENALRTALLRNEFSLVYQPQYELASARITGIEALIRWCHPDLGLVFPDQFIPIAEKSGLILSIGEWVLRTACAQVCQWQIEGLSVVPIAVNVSAVQFRGDDFCEVVKQVLRETGLPAELLELELTESVLLANADRTNSMLREFAGMEVKLAIDDFGTGYSSLSYLKQFLVNKLKIDRSFVKDLPTDGDDAAITIAIINMAKSLNLTVVAEGVETEEQMTFLRGHQCDQVQGYYFSKPVTPQEMALKLELSSARDARLSILNEVRF